MNNKKNTTTYFSVHRVTQHARGDRGTGRHAHVHARRKSARHGRLDVYTALSGRQKKKNTAKTQGGLVALEMC